MGFFKNFGKGATGGDGKPNIDPAVAALEEAGYLIEIMHIASGKTAVFPSWITDFSDNYQSAWQTQTVFGRNDQIGTFQNTTRTISVAMNIPSFSVVEARENLHQVEHLIANLYPSYSTYKGVDTMVGSPLVKVKFGNLIKNAKVRTNAVSVAKGGLSGWLTNVNFAPDINSGFHHMSPRMSTKDQKSYNGHFEGRTSTNASHTFLPKVLTLNFNMNVVHEHRLGWRGTNWMGADSGGAASFPYGIETLSGKQHFTPGQAGATTRTQGKVAEQLIGKVFKGTGKL